MDPEQLVAQLAELRTQNQQLHQALQQVQQQQSQQQGLVQALSATVPCAQSGSSSVGRSTVEMESATVAEANAATEVVVPPDTLRMLADQVYTVLMTLVEGESFVILVGSGSGEGLEAWRRQHKTLGPLDDWKSERIAQRNHFTWTCQAGRAARSSGTT